MVCLRNVSRVPVRRNVKIHRHIRTASIVNINERMSGERSLPVLRERTSSVPQNTQLGGNVADVRTVLITALRSPTRASYTRLDDISKIYCCRPVKSGSLLTTCLITRMIWMWMALRLEMPSPSAPTTPMRKAREAPPICPSKQKTTFHGEVNDLFPNSMLTLTGSRNTDQIL